LFISAWKSGGKIRKRVGQQIPEKKKEVRSGARETMKKSIKKWIYPDGRVKNCVEGSGGLGIPEKAGKK